MKATTSRDRFDERKRFSGVFQQMGRVALDSDWNEQVHIRTADARRRTQDVAHGSPDDGFRISDEQVIDDIDGLSGWGGALLTEPDERVIREILEIDRREPAGLPHVVKGGGRVELLHTMPRIVDLDAVPLEPAGSFAATHVVVRLRFDRPTNDQDLVHPVLRFFDDDGAHVDVDVITLPLPGDWRAYRIPMAQLAGIDRTRLARWGVVGLPRRATVWIDALTAIDGPARHDDLVIRGGDGTIAGAGRMLVHGHRAWLTTDTRYTRQEDLPEPPALPALDPGGADKHLVYLDVWERTVLADQDPALVEPALAGLDTTFRQQLVRQVRVLPALAADASEALPGPTGDLRLSTDISSEEGLPDRYPTATGIDPCRDRCLSSQERSLGEGYVGHENLHVRVEVIHADGPRPVIAWSRDNGATRLPLVETAQAGDQILRLSPADAALLRTGDVLVVGDDVTDLQPDGPRPPSLRVVLGSDPATGLVQLEDAAFVLTTDPDPLNAGGTLAHAYTVERNAYVRRWDGADWMIPDVRYNLPDGITFRFHAGEARRGEYWSFIARLVAPDGETRGYLEKLDTARVHGPIHHRIALSRVTREGNALHFADLRPRFLPLVEVRDRLQELAAEQPDAGAFTLTIGDGRHTFGDIDQDLRAGVTADEALQNAVDRLKRWMRGVEDSDEDAPTHSGGTIYIRAGLYQLLHPVVLDGLSRVRILGDGDASELRVVGAGGAFVLDRCGRQGTVGIERLLLIEDPEADNVIGADAGGAEEDAPTGTPLEPGDLAEIPGESPSFLAKAAASLKHADVFSHRAMAALLATLARLRFLQRRDPGVDMEEHPEGSRLLTVIRALPHGVVTVSDSRRVHLSDLTVRSADARLTATGVLLTGHCRSVRVSRCDVSAHTGLAAVPLGPFLRKATLALYPWSSLTLDGLVVEDCLFAGGSEALHGIRLVDGWFADVAVRDNRIDGSLTGIELRTARWRGSSDGRALQISGNRVTGTAGLGIDVDGAYVRLEDNEVRPRAGDSLVQLGIRVTGSRGSIESCRVHLPSRPISPLGLLAGICVGSGLDDGSDARRTAEDVEIRGCHVVGATAANPAIGVVLGGREAVYDVRVRDCVFQDLGDAAVRAWGHGGPVGRIRIEDNRVEQVAADAPPSSATVLPALRDLAPDVAQALVDAGVNTTNPGALLDALATRGAAAVPALDAVLRWVAQFSLRGAFVLDHTLQTEVRGNRVQTVGDDTHVAGVRTAGIAIVGGTDSSVTDNHVEDVRGGLTMVEGPGPSPAPSRPAAFDVLQGLALAIGEDRLERSDLHLASVRLRALVLAYIEGDENRRQELGRRIYAPMEALADELDSYTGQGSQIASQLVLEADEMRAAQGYDAHTEAAFRVLASVSRSAGFTAQGDDAQDAWDAITTLDLSIVSGDEAIAAEASRIQDGLEVLARGQNALAKVIFSELAALLGKPSDTQLRVNAARTLGRLGLVRDAEAVAPVARPGIYGRQRTIVTRFAKSLSDEAARLAEEPSDARGELLGALRPDKDALVGTLRETNPELARDLEADWRAIDRAVTPPTDERLERLRGTLGAVQGWADGVSAPPSSDATLARREEAGEAALAGMVAKHIDKNLAGLGVEPESTRTKSLKVLQRTSLQLLTLVGDDPELEGLARSARGAITSAASETANRSTRLAEARTALERLRRTTEWIVPRTPEAEAPPPADALDRRLASLASIALALPKLDADGRDDGVTLILGHIDPVLDAANMQGRPRSTTVTALEKAGAVLRKPKLDSGADTALHAILRELDRSGNAAVTPSSPTGVQTVAALVHAAALAIDPSVDADTRLAQGQAALRERAAVLSGSWTTRLAGLTDLTDVVSGLADALDRIAQGERPRAPALAEPHFDRVLDPADGVLALGPRARLHISDNVVRTATRGVTLSDGGTHPLAEPDLATGIVASLTSNRIDGCLLGAVDVDLRVDASVTVAENEVFACSGLAEAGRSGIGQAVLGVSGRGDLAVRDNTLRGSGHQHENAVLHEIVIDWKGDVAVVGNVVRHHGGEGGGAGILVVAERNRSDLPRDLSRAAFLGLEPPPRATPSLPELPLIPRIPALPIFTPITTLSKASLSAVSSGRLSQSISTTRLSPRTLTTLRQPLATTPAATFATSRLAGLVKPVSGLLDLIRPPIIPRPTPPPPEHLTVHLQGNDVASTGPALLVISEPGRDVVSASVVGNALHSVGTTGAVYVRYPDSLVLGSNRCEAARVVNVVLVRCSDATVASTGNVVVGAEPVAPPAPPAVPQPPRITRPTLRLPVGSVSIDVPVSRERLLGNLEAFTGAARQAFSDILVARSLAEPEPALADLVFQEEEPPPIEEDTLAGGVELRSFTTTSTSTGTTLPKLEAGKLISKARPTYEIKLFEGTTDAQTVLSTLKEREDLTSEDITAAMRGTTITAFETEDARKSFILEVDLLRKEKKIAELAAANEVDVATDKAAATGVFSRVRDTGTTQEGALATMTKLLAAQGYRSERVGAETRALLDESDGDARAALDKLQKDLFATDQASAPARKAIEQTNLLERLLAEGVIGGSASVDEEDEEEELAPPPPPDPYSHSFVILGGAAVTSVGNATTSGSLVLGAHDSVTLDV